MKPKLKLATEQSLDLSIVLSSTDAIMIADAKAAVEWVNESFSRMTQYAVSDVKGENFIAHLTGTFTDKEAIERMCNAVKTKTPFNEEILCYKKDGEPIWLSISITPVFSEESNFLNFVAVMRDITERKQTERQIAYLQAKLAGVKILDGFITKCAWDKTVKDKSGKYIDIEEYIERYTEARFTHGISPEARDRVRKSNDP
jgi:PAS domain S-box-containing protein